MKVQHLVLKQVCWLEMIFFVGKINHCPVAVAVCLTIGKSSMTEGESGFSAHCFLCLLSFQLQMQPLCTTVVWAGFPELAVFRLLAANHKITFVGLIFITEIGPGNKTTLVLFLKITIQT